MLTVKTIIGFDETLIEAARVEYVGSSRAVLVRPSHDTFAGETEYHCGLIYVMNDKGATVAKYDLDTNRDA